MADNFENITIRYRLEIEFSANIVITMAIVSIYTILTAIFNYSSISLSWKRLSVNNFLLKEKK